MENTSSHAQIRSIEEKQTTEQWMLLSTIIYFNNLKMTHRNKTWYYYIQVQFNWTNYIWYFLSFILFQTRNSQGN